MIKPEDFEKLDRDVKDALIEKHNETERMWFTKCPKCGFKTYGTLQKLRGKPCGACGSG